MENWIHCIHSASASAFARQRGNGDNVVQILRNEIKRIEARIEDDEKLKKMAKLQSKVVSDVRNKQTIVDQVVFLSLPLTLNTLSNNLFDKLSEILG